VACVLHEKECPMFQISNNSIIGNHVPDIGERFELGQFGEVVVMRVYHDSHGNYLRLQIKHLDGRLFESDFSFRVSRERVSNE